MSYLVIARKWRPQTFEDVVGQSHVTRTLQNALRSQRVAHAYLFTGARGVGKTSVARILAKALNCGQGPGDTPCNACSNCTEITQGNAPDVLEIDGASNRGIDNIRELRETARYRPAKSRYKIYIIDEVHMLTTEAFNALLKTLEEPPDHVLFVFATTEPHKIPATILSRCQRFDFRRIPTQQVVDHLRNIAHSEGSPLSETILYAIAREADGSMRDAQSLLEQLLAFSGDGLGDEEILDVLGVVDRRSVHQAGRAILTGDVRLCLEVVNDLHRRGMDSRRFCQHLCDHFRNLLFLTLAEGQAGAWLDLPDEEREALRDVTTATTPETLHMLFQMLLKGEEDIRRSSLPRITLEVLLLRLTQAPRVESLSRLVDQLASLQGSVECARREGVLPKENFHTPQTASPPPVERAPPARPFLPSQTIAETAPHPDLPPPPPVLAPFPEQEPSFSEGAGSATGFSTGGGPLFLRWPEFISWLEVHAPILGAKLAGSHAVQPPGEPGENIEIEVLEIFEESFKDPLSLARLSDAARAFCGEAPQWVIKGKRGAAGKAPDGEVAKASRGASRVSVMHNPVVMQALEILGGELVDIRPAKKIGKGREDKPGSHESQ